MLYSKDYVPGNFLESTKISHELFFLKDIGLNSKKFTLEIFRPNGNNERDLHVQGKSGWD